MKIMEDLFGFIWTNPTANNCNSYFIDGEKRILIDPGHYHFLSHIRESLSRLSLDLQDMDLVVLTHGHPDHMEGIRVFVDMPTLVTIHQKEMDFIQKSAPQYEDSIGMFASEFDFLLDEGDLQVGNLTFQVIATPGHSPGSICLYWPDRKALFTGDTVFYQGVGRTDLPGGNGDQLKESIKKISGLDVEYLLPGHGTVLSGHDRIKANFEDIERMWFGYL